MTFNFYKVLDMYQCKRLSRLIRLQTKIIQIIFYFHNNTLDVNQLSPQENARGLR